MVRLPAAGKIVPNSDGAAGSDMMELGVRTFEQPMQAFYFLTFALQSEHPSGLSTAMGIIIPQHPKSRNIGDRSIRL